MADGSVKIDVGLNIGKAEKDLSKLVDKINKAEDALNAESDKKNGLVQQIDAANKKLDEAKEKAIEVQKELQQESAAADAKLDEAKATVNDIRAEMAGARGSAKAEIRERLNEALDNQRMYQAEADRLAKETAKATEELTTGSKEVRETQKEINKLNNELDKTNAKIEQGEKNLTEMKEEAGQLTQQIERARPGEAIANSLETAKKGMMKFLKYAFGIRTVFILFRRLKSAISESVKAYAEQDKELKTQLATLDATKKAIQLASGAALGGIYQAILPIVQKIANWMLEAANAAARFIAIISGRTSYKKAVVDTAEVAAGLEDTSAAADDVADSAKEAKKQLMGFDELNILDDNKDSGSSGRGGGGSGGGAGGGVSFVEEALDGFNDTFLDHLALSVRDVLFDWSDLNPEQIAEKIIAGLSAVLGLALGITLGLGPGGVILMTLGGLTLGLVLDALIFNHDGVINPSEIADMISLALTALAGGVIGFLAGGPGGALIGSAVSLGLFAALKAVDIKAFGGQANLVNKLATALTVLAGAAIGFFVGGPAGALIGATVGIGVSAIVESLKFSKLDDEERAKYRSGLDWFIVGVLGLPTDEQLKQWGIDAINWIGQGFIDLTHVLHDIIGGPLENLIEKEIPEIIKQFKNIGRDAINWLGQGFIDFTRELHNIIGGPLENFVENDIPQAISWFKELGPTAISWIREGFSNLLNDLQEFIGAPFHNFMNGLLEWWANLRLQPFHIPHPVFEWGTKEATGLVAKALQFVGLEPVLPTLSIGWYAKGGIFDMPSLIGVGENGKEAVLPLEKNTEWMQLLADGLMERFEKKDFANRLADAFLHTPLPAMAGGGVVPPNAYSAGYGGDMSAAAVLEELRELRNAILSQPIQCTSKTYLDKRQIGQAVTEYQRNSDRANGVS